MSRKIDRGVLKHLVNGTDPLHPEKKNKISYGFYLGFLGVVFLLLFAVGITAFSDIKSEDVSIPQESKEENQPKATLSLGFWTGRCVGVTDGDSIKVMHNGKSENVRLNGVDCPEHNQAFGTRAKQFTSNFAYNKEVIVRPKEKDRYGRTIADVYVDGRSLNEAIVAVGLAWWYYQYAPDQQKLELLQRTAQAEKRGLWSDKNPIPPWDFRRGKVQEDSTTANTFGSHPSPEQTASDQIVYTTDNGDKYHSAGCKYLSRSRHSIKKSEAISMGYKPCSVCKP